VQLARDPEVAVAQREQAKRALDLEIARRCRCLHVPLLLVVMFSERAGV
jgi:hypothetical protein